MSISWRKRPRISVSVFGPSGPPDDPFSGKEFVYRRQGAGFRLYSLGPDLKDNKGQPILFGKDRKTPPESESGWDGDIVWVSRR